MTGMSRRRVARIARIAVVYQHHEWWTRFRGVVRIVMTACCGNTKMDNPKTPLLFYNCRSY